MTRQTWFVTGAASRLGADIVRSALAAGHRVVAADADPLAALAAIGPVTGERLLAVAVDEVHADSVAAAVQAAVDRFGAIDVAVHGAAACAPTGDATAPAPRIDFAASVRALFNVTRGLLVPMREQHAGRIHHLVPPPTRANGPTLFSIPGFCASVAADVAPFGIEVSALEPQAWPRLLRAGSDSDRGELLEAA